MSGQKDKPHTEQQLVKIRSDIKSNDYYGYTLLRDFCENPMREMPTLEKVGAWFEGMVAAPDKLLLLEPFGFAYDIDTIGAVETFRAYEMGHDDYYFIETVKPVESPVAGPDGYAMVLDRSETVYGYLKKGDVVPCSDERLLQRLGTRGSKKGVIDDPDGYTNIRKERNAKSEIAGKIYANEVFDYWELHVGNWYPVLTRDGLRGFIYKDRVKTKTPR